MKVRLISYSEPSEEMKNDGVLNLEDLVAYCARVSNPANQLSSTTNNKLIKYLMDHKHWSPFEVINICLEIESTRDIIRQILRHRSFSFQEFSQRYADPTKDLYFVTKEARLQDTKNRQNSVETDDKYIQTVWEIQQQAVQRTAEEAYKWAINAGIAKEQARAVLPEGMTASRIYMNGTLRSWLHYVELRSSNGTQKEHMEIAKECGKVIGTIFPVMLNFIN